jgi:glycosyltransferase involved in cell wall biosynthesis
VSGERTQSARTKVAVLIGVLEVGGAELDIVRNFPRLNREEFDVVVVTFSSAGSLAPELERQGIRVISRTAEVRAAEKEPGQGLGGEPNVSEPVAQRNDLPPIKRAISAVFKVPPIAWILRKAGTALYMARVTRWVGRTFQAEKIDIAHFFLPHSYVYGMFGCALWRAKAKTVMSRLSLNFYKDSQKLIAGLERNLLHRRVDIAIGNSKLILDELAEEGVDPRKLRLLYNGIDPEPFARRDEDRAQAREALGIEQDAFTIVAVGNLYAHKGHPDLIEACARVVDRLPRGWRLLIAGRDELGNRAVYEKLVADRGLADHVSLLGACDNIAEVLFAADVFVHPSHHEGLPNAIIEAMAASLPVIGTAVGGVPEAVSARPDGAAAAEETGWLVAPKDPESIAAALLEASDDPERRLRMGEHARARVAAEFSLDKSVSSYEKIYRELVS